MWRPVLETASWAACIASALIALYLLLAPAPQQPPQPELKKAVEDPQPRIDKRVSPGPELSPGPKLESPQPPTLPETSNDIGKKVVAHGFILDLKACKRSGGNVICQFAFVNDSSADVEAGFYASSTRDSRMFDNEGYDYKASEAQLGSKKDSMYITLALVPHIVTNGSLKFEKVNPGSKIITLLRVSCYYLKDNDWKYWNADFKNILIQ